LITNVQGHRQETSKSQAHKQEISYAQSKKQETSKQTKLHRKMFGMNTWYTISDVHNTNQKQTLKILEFLSYESL